MTDAQNHKETTARKIIYYREKRGWSQTQIANKIKINRNRYASYELRRAIVPHSVIEAICEAYEITMDDFKKLKIPVNHVHNIG